MAEALSETRLCNMSLARIGAKRLNNLETDASEEAIHCRTHYGQTRDALVRSHWWRFASARATLSQDATDPSFEWDYQFDLPADFIAMKSVYEDNNTSTKTSTYSYALEGKKFLTNEDSVEIRYIKQVEDPTKFDPLFTEVLVLQLALKLVMPLAGDRGLYREIFDELRILMSKVRALDRQETTTIGRSSMDTWDGSRD